MVDKELPIARYFKKSSDWEFPNDKYLKKLDDWELPNDKKIKKCVIWESKNGDNFSHIWSSSFKKNQNIAQNLYFFLANLVYDSTLIKFEPLIK